MTVLSVDSAQVPFLLRDLFPDTHLGPPLALISSTGSANTYHPREKKVGMAIIPNPYFVLSLLISGVFGLTPLNVDFNTARLTHASATLLSAYGSITQHVIGEFWALFVTSLVA